MPTRRRPFYRHYQQRGSGDRRVARRRAAIPQGTGRTEADSWLQPATLRVLGWVLGLGDPDSAMTIIMLTPVRLLGDGLIACLRSRPDMSVLAVINDLASLRQALGTSPPDVVLVDVTQGIDLFDIRAIAAQWPDVALVALGLTEQRQDVIQCGRAGFAGYVSRDASIDELCHTLSEIVAGRLACSPEIAGGLLRALFRRDQRMDEPDTDLSLTRRESEVLELLGHGLSNKEIGDQLCLSVATVKHHVHHVLAKLRLPKRAQAMRRVRDEPWLARMSSIGKK